MTLSARSLPRSQASPRPQSSRFHVSSLKPGDAVHFELDLHLHELLPDSLRGKLQYAPSMEMRQLMFGMTAPSGSQRDTYAHINDLGSRANGDIDTGILRLAVKRLQSTDSQTNAGQLSGRPTSSKLNRVSLATPQSDVENVAPEFASVASASSKGKYGPAPPLVKPLDLSRVRPVTQNSRTSSASRVSSGMRLSELGCNAEKTSRAPLSARGFNIIDAVMWDAEHQLVDPMSARTVTRKTNPPTKHIMLVRKYYAHMLSRLPPTVLKRANAIHTEVAIGALDAQVRDHPENPIAATARSQSARSAMLSARLKRNAVHEVDAMDQFEAEAKAANMFCGVITQMDLQRGLVEVEIWSRGVRYAIDTKPRIWVPAVDLKEKMEHSQFERHVKQPFLRAFSEFRYSQDTDRQRELAAVKESYRNPDVVANPPSLDKRLSAFPRRSSWKR